MAESRNRDTVSPGSRSERLRLNVEIYDELASAREFGSVAEQAARHGVNRQHWYAIRNGTRAPGGALAMRVADQLGVSVHAIWRREVVTADA